MRWRQAAVATAILGINGGIAMADSDTAFDANYVGALQKSLYFYEAQRSGPKTEDSRVEWRGDAAVDDGKAEGVDLSGGWFDAGDHVKFGFPAAATATLLAWSLIETPEGYSAHGQDGAAYANLKWINDYFINAHSAPNELWAQVGEGGPDHAYWGPAETMPMARPAFKIDASCPGSDLAAETAAAMAAASLAFEQRDAAYAAQLEAHARSLYQFADDYRGIYSMCVRDAQGFYRSSGYYDELVWGALWLYRLTGEAGYLEKAESLFQNLKDQNEFPYRWTHAWDDKTYGSYILLARLTGKAQYREAAERWLDYWTVGVGGSRVSYTPGGLAWLDSWGALRYTSNTAMLALYYAKDLEARGESLKATRYHAFAKRQIDYMLGQNPDGRSYVVGFGRNPPVNPHHRGAHGSWANNIETPATNRHILYGALVGGPDAMDRYTDDRRDYVKNEVAVDYNAGFTGALAALATRYGGTPEVDFPPREIPDDELFVTAKSNAEGADFFELALKLHNHTTRPARITRDIKARYFFNLSEISDHARVYQAIRVVTNYNQGAVVSGVKPFDASRGLYFIDMDFSNARLAPTSDSDSQKEVQVRMVLPRSQDRWSSDNDWSYRGIGRQDFVKTRAITVYENGRQVWGHEPDQASTTR
jgi:endoglucanase